MTPSSRSVVENAQLMHSHCSGPKNFHDIYLYLVRLYLYICTFSSSQNRNASKHFNDILLNSFHVWTREKIVLSILQAKKKMCLFPFFHHLVSLWTYCSIMLNAIFKYFYRIDFPPKWIIQNFFHVLLQRFLFINTLSSRSFVNSGVFQPLKGVVSRNIFRIWRGWLSCQLVNNSAHGCGVKNIRGLHRKKQIFYPQGSLKLT